MSREITNECVRCGAFFSPARAALGYMTCLPCGDAAARGVKFCVTNLHKSSFTVITNRAELAQLNPKRVGG